MKREDKVIKAITKWEDENPPKMETQLILEQKRGRGDKGYIAYHNINEGKDYNSVEDAMNGRKSTLIKKESFSLYKWRKEHPNQDKNLLVFGTTKSDLNAVVVETIEFDIDGEVEKLLAVQSVSLNLRKIDVDEKRDFERYVSFYVDKHKYFYGRGYQGNMCCYESANDFWSFTYWLNDNANSLGAKSGEDDNLLREASKMGWEIVNCGGNSRIVLNGLWSLSEFLKYKEPAMKKGPKQKHINELVLLGIEDAPEESFSFADEADEVNYAYRANVVKVENGDTPTVCYRTYMVSRSGNKYEGARIYIEPGKVTACRTTNAGEWISVSLSLDNRHFAYPITYVNKDALTGTILEYIIPMLGDISGEEIGAILASTLRHPCIEIIYKSELKKYIVSAAKYRSTNIWNQLEEKFGTLNEKKKGIYHIIGLNKKQLEYVLNAEEEFSKIENTNGYFDKTINIVAKIKKILCSSHINDIDFDSFKNITDAIVDIYTTKSTYKIVEKSNEYILFGYHYCRDFVDILVLISKNWGLVTLNSMVPKVVDLFKQYDRVVSNSYCGNRSNAYYCTVYDSYFDYLSMVDYLEDKAGIGPHFRTQKDIQIMHDDIMPVFNYQKSLERAAKDAEKLKNMQNKWNTRVNFWKKWQYENDDYSVVIPTKPADLTFEGISLGHCVGGYIDRVLEHKTNIVFIRRTNDAEKSLFTVEVSNQGIVEQIHGFHNNKIDDIEVVAENPKLKDFISEWIDNTDIRLSQNVNKVR